MIRYEEIVLDNKGGRNRAKACEIGSPRTYILAINVKRRHMSKGQQAMAQAMIYPNLVHRFQSSNHMRRLDRVYRNHV